MVLTHIDSCRFLPRVFGKFLLAIIIGLSWAQANSSLQAATQVTRNGITWYFNQDYTVGQYVNGDYWVLDPGSGVRINSVTPSPGGGRHGSMINPRTNDQAYDSRIHSYDSSLGVSFPATLQGGDSLVSAESLGSQGDECDGTGMWLDVYGYCVYPGHVYLWRAAVLTVVSSVPGSNDFRPAYYGNTKTSYSYNSVDWNKLPKLPLGTRPGVAEVNKVAGMFENVWLDKYGWTGRMMHPVKNMPNYGREMGWAASRAGILLMMDYSQNDLRELLINFVQTGIDTYAMRLNGMSWPGEGGHDNGRKFMIFFAGIMLNNSAMQNVSGTFAENNNTYYGNVNSNNPGQSKRSFFGRNCVSDYTATCSGGGAKDCRDPAGLKDGCSDYRNCCTSPTWIGQALVTLILDAKEVWDHDAFFDYCDRWMGHGNDPMVGGGGSAKVSYIDDMWHAYRDGLDEVDTVPPLPASNVTLVSSGLNFINIQWDQAPMASDGDYARSYNVYRNQVLVQSVTTPSFNDVNLAPSTSYTYAIYSVDNVGNVSQSAADGTFSTQADADLDNLPDTWEQQYFGNLNQSGSDDPDGDNITNAQELLRGSDPTQFDDISINLLLDMKFDDSPNDGARDDSSNSYNGVTAGHMPALATGLVNGAYQFSGSQYVSIADSALSSAFPGSSSNPASAFTIAVWMKLDGNGQRNPILAKQSSAGRSIIVSKEESNRVAVELSSNGSSNQTFTTSQTVSAGQWYHLAVSYAPDNNGTVKFYLNGQLDSTHTNAGGAPASSNDDVNIGRYYWNGSYSAYFAGALDELLVYDIALSDGEVQALAQIDTGPTNSAPVLQTIGNRSVEPDASLSFTLSASDADGDTLTFSHSTLPTGASFNSTTRTFSWTPTDSQDGTYSVTFTVSDGQAGDSETVTITVSSPPPPDLIISHATNWVNTSIQPQSGAFMVTFDAEATDALIDGVMGFSNGDADWYTDLAISIRFNNSGYIDARDYNGYRAENSIPYQPDTTYTFRLEVDMSNSQSGFFYNVYVKPDGGSETMLGQNFQFRAETAAISQIDRVVLAPGGSHQLWNLQLDDYTVNHPPVLNPLSNITANEGDVIQFTVSAIDPDPGDALLYSVQNRPVGATFVGSVFFWVPGNSAAGVYNVTFIVSDDGSLTDSQQITITVNDVPVNQAPEFPSIGTQSLQENQQYTLDLQATDPDGDSLSYSATGLPVGATLSGSTLSWTPTYDQAGSYDVTLTVSDGQEEASQVVTLNVNNLNRPPILGPISNINASINSPISLTVSGSDPDGDSLTYWVQGLPPGASFSNQTQTLSWTPGQSDVGDHTLTVFVGDGDLSDSQAVQLSITTINAPPVLDPIAAQSIDENGDLTLTITASDPDGDSLSYSATGLPAGAQLSGSSLSWTPTYDQSGVYSVTIIVSDGELSDSQIVTLTVVNVNRPPVFINPVASQSLDTEEVLSLTFTATDPDGDSVTISFNGLPTGATTSSGQLNWTPDSTQTGNHTITVTASDGELQSQHTLTLTVGTANRPPVLDPLSAQSVDENNLLTLTANATDPDGDTLTYSAIGLPDGAQFSGADLSWTPTFDQAGSYNVTITVSDGELSDSQVVNLTVVNVNRAPVLNEVSDILTWENRDIQITLQASDPDGDPLTYSALNLPADASLTGQNFSWSLDFDTFGFYSIIFIVSDGQLQHSRTMTIEVRNVNQVPILDPVPDKTIAENALLSFNLSGSDPDGTSTYFEADNLPEGATLNGSNIQWRPTYNQAGTYTVTAKITDGFFYDEQDFTITVTEVNRAPVLSSISDVSVNEGEVIAFTAQASDPDGDAVTISVLNLPAGASFSDGAFFWTTDLESAGTYSITVVASDGTLQDSQPVTLLVGSTNRPPVLDPIGPQSAEEGQWLRFTVNGSDDDGDTLSFSSTDLPAGATFAGGEFAWKPDFDAAGDYSFTLAVSDGVLQDAETVSVTVANTNRGPTFSSNGNKSVSENETLTFQLSATDPDGDNITYTADQLPVGSTLVGPTFTWTPDYDDAGTYTADFMVSDGDMSDSQTITIIVVDKNRAPVITAIDSISVAETERVSFAVTASDPDDDAITLTMQNAPASALFSAGQFDWTPTFEDAGSYSITFVASDGDLEDRETVTIVVGSTNRPPVLGHLTDAQIPEDQSYSVSISASDPDGDEITIRALNLPVGATFDDGLLSWKPGFDQSGQHIITFEADDGELTHRRDLSLTVLNVNRPPVINGATDVTITESQALTLNVTVSDPDGDTVTLDAQQLPVGATFVDNALTWTPGYDDAGIYSIRFQASDGLTDELVTVLVTVTNVNRPPVWTPMSERLIGVNETLSLAVQANDPDDEQLLISVQNLPDGATFDGLNLRWTPLTGSEGTHVITFIASDGEAQVQTTLSITVSGIDNTPPVWDPISNQTVNENELLTFTVSASDDDGDELTYSAEGLPAGASFNTGLFQWRPDFEAAGAYDVVLVVHDGMSSDSVTVSISVVHVNRPPVITSVASQYGNLNESIQFAVQASDPDGDTVSVSALSLPGSANFSGQTFAWTPTLQDVGSVTVTFVADDGELQSSATTTIYVSATSTDPDAPSVSEMIPSPGAIQIEVNSMIVIEISDAASGVDASSPQIEIDGEIVYQGNVSSYESALGVCRRSGSSSRYTYTVQPWSSFHNDQRVDIGVRAKDLQGNVMLPYASSFTTQMHTFGQAVQLNDGQRRCDLPAAAQGPDQTLWVVWEEGATGSRDIYLVRKSGGINVFDPAVKLIDQSGDQAHPSIAIDGAGHLYVAWQDNAAGNWQIMLSYSSDGETWSTPQALAQSQNDQTRPVLAADDVTVYVAWEETVNGQSEIAVCHSDDQFANSTVVALTQHTAQQIEPTIAVINHVAYVVWTDLRHSTANLYGAASNQGWANVPVVADSANQSQPVLAGLPDSQQLCLAWVDDRLGNNDIFTSQFSNGLPGLPVSGVNVVDDSTGRSQVSPTLLVVNRDGEELAYLAWEDHRNADTLLDPDIYFVALGSNNPTNVLITDSSGTSAQSRPAMAAADRGDPIVFWIDQQNNADDLYCAGVTNIAGQQVAAETVTATDGGVVGTPLNEINSVDDVSAEVPAGAFPSDVTLTISQVSNPVVDGTVEAVLASYDFGPSMNMEFAQPVTLTIPYEVQDPQTNVGVYWYNPQTGELSQSGLSNMEIVEVTPNLRAIRFKTSHFSQYLVADIAKPSKRAGRRGGGCIISNEASSARSIGEYLLPFLAVLAVVVRMRRRAGMVAGTAALAHNRSEVRNGRFR